MNRIVALGVAGLIAAAAPAQAGGPNETLGTIIGAAGGGLIGSQIGRGPGKAAATVAGIAVGAAIGNGIGRDADRAGPGPVYVHERWRHHRDPYWAGYAYAEPAPVYVEPAPVYVERPRCGPVAEQVYVNGWPRTIYRTACLQADGTWRIVR
jgi:hypothetical protein